MRRREFFAFLGATAAWPLVVNAQQGTMPLIGFILPGSKETSKRFYDGFPLGMEQRGYLEGRDYALEARYGDGDSARLPPLARELLRLNPYVVVAAT